MDLREIDRLVAEKVMGCEEAPSIWFADYDKSKKYYCISDTPNKEISIIEYVDRGWVQYLFHSSENIADAWQVVEKLRKDNIMIDITPSETVYFASVRHQGKEYIVRSIKAETAPLAICLAALKSIGIDVEV
jgi:hypothetical protein